MGETYSFGDWVRRRRKALDLTQAGLARQVGCAVSMIRKIEADERRPSQQVAALLATALQVPDAERDQFLQVARGERGTDRLATSDGSIPAPPVPRTSHQLPSGTVTFLFTDIAGSTRLWEQHPQAMPAALARHDAILRHTIASHGGMLVKGTGDGLHAAFARAPEAITAALEAQRTLVAEEWGAIGTLRVRMALHTGVAVERDGDYYGPVLNRVARLLAAGHGGQILLSRATCELVRDHLSPRVTLRDLGVHRLKDLRYPEQIYQLSDPDLPATFPPLASLDVHRHNLPVQVTSFIGRERELAELGALLEDPGRRLVTIVGPGGIGKTRLALAAAEQAEAFADGAAFVPLAAVSATAFVAPTILGALGVGLQGQRDPREQLRASLRPKELLLVLDNLEQLLAPEQRDGEGLAELLVELLQHAPGVTLLLTSRERLSLPGEWLFELAGLPYPQGDPGEDVAAYGAIQLFVQRARQLRPQFALAGEAGAVAHICRLVEGMPLAIELAAAGLRGRSCAAIATMIESGVTTLASGQRAVAERHRSIVATFEYSWQLLSGRERQVLACLSVFRGGFDEEAAAQIAQATPELLAALLDKSLLRWDGVARYDMHELVRKYAGEKLEQVGAATETRKHHAVYFLGLVETTEPKLRGPEQARWLVRLEVEHDNLRAALRWAIDSLEGELGLRLAGALFWFWDRRDYFSEARRWLDAVLAQTNGLGRTAVRAKALYARGVMDHGPGSVSYPFLEESAAIWREVGDKRGLALALSALGMVMLYERRLDVARSFFEEGVALCRELNDTWSLATTLYGLGAVVRRDDPAAARPVVEESVALHREVGDRSYLAGGLMLLGTIARSEGDLARAGALFEESLALNRELGRKTGISGALQDLGNVAQDQGNFQRAMMLYQESLALIRHLEIKERIAQCLVGLGGVAGALRQPERAARLLSAAETMLDTIGLSVSVWPEVRADYDHYVAAARLAGPDHFAAAWAEGRAMTLDQAIAYALEGSIDVGNRVGQGVPPN